VIAVVAEEGDDLSGAADFAAKASSQNGPGPGSKQEQKQPEPEKPSAPKPEAPKSSPSHSTPELPAGDRIFASPIAKKIALDRGIPLSQIKGTGPNGRIVREDVEKFKPATSTVASSATAEPDYVDTPLSNMRRTIAQRLSQSKQDLPHYYLTVEISMDRVMKLREVFNKSLAQKETPTKLSVNDFVIKAAACALADVPEANSAWLGDAIRT
jgi:pyruvate dehydrogenase E2 component (dihydrolipoamide acetyltransferase)